MSEPTREKWQGVIDSLAPIIDSDGLTLLRSCLLSEENGHWFLLAPNQFALNRLNEKYLSSVKLALNKQGISNIKSKIDDSDLFSLSQRKKSAQQKPFESNLNTDYQFDNFVVGKSNDNAFAAAHRVSEGLFSDEFNPLLIYGGTGLGKSHLMHAAGNALRVRGSSRIMYLTAEEFTNDFTNTLKDPKRSMREFTEYYRNADALLIDDVQFLAGKNSSQAEFFHTFNSLFDKKRQIILTCDRYPKEIEGLEDRLKSRFGSGLTVSIEPPDYETRVAILQSKAEKLDFDLPGEVEQFIAHNVVSNVRELEGALRKVYAHCQFKGTSATIDIARSALNDLIIAQNKQITLSNIRNIVANYYHISLVDMDSKSRKASVTLPRQIAMHLAKALTRHSYPEIGKVFGGRDHSTVIHACEKISRLYEEDADFREEYKGLRMTITG